MAKSETDREGYASDCPCLNLKCSKWGDCVACVRMHRTNRTHVPECLQPMLRDYIAAIAEKVELKVTDARPAASLEEARKRGEKVY